MASHEDRVLYWTELVSEQKLSGLSVPNFCRERGVSIHSYRGWRARLNKETSSGGDWVTVKSHPAIAKPAPITLRVGAVCFDLALGFDPQLVQDIVAALNPQC
jgi:hypothetical protein